MQKRFILSFTICFLFLFLTACGPSEEKIAQAQQKYSELAETHNNVVEAHKSISDNSLDEALTALADKVTIVGNYNLQEMKDEEIDLLIQTMDSLIDSYDEFMTALTDIKGKEDAAVLTPIPVTLINDTGFYFSGLSLFEQGSLETPANVLESLPPLEPGQSLTGLLIQRNVDNTPWLLTLSDTDGGAWEFSLPVENYEEEGITLRLLYNSQESELTIEREEENAS